MTTRGGAALESFDKLAFDPGIKGDTSVVAPNFSREPVVFSTGSRDPHPDRQVGLPLGDPNAKAARRCVASGRAAATMPTGPNSAYLYMSERLPMEEKSCFRDHAVRAGTRSAGAAPDEADGSTGSTTMLMSFASTPSIDSRQKQAAPAPTTIPRPQP
jgi:hypothetical protein